MVEESMKVRCIENRFALRIVGPDTFVFVDVDDPHRSLKLGKVYEVLGELPDFVYIQYETPDGAVYAAEFLQRVKR